MTTCASNSQGITHGRPWLMGAVIICRSRLCRVLRRVLPWHGGCCFLVRRLLICSPRVELGVRVTQARPVRTLHRAHRTQRLHRLAVRPGLAQRRRRGNCGGSAAEAQRRPDGGLRRSCNGVLIVAAFEGDDRAAVRRQRSCAGSVVGRACLLATVHGSHFEQFARSLSQRNATSRGASTVTWKAICTIALTFGRIGRWMRRSSACVHAAARPPANQ